MNDYTVYLELFGKKMKTTVQAKSEEDAKYQIYGKIKFHKVVQNQSEVDHLKSIFGMFD